MKTDRRSTDTRQRLIDTTLDLIDSNGWHTVTLSGVARACGVTTPACYKHFPSKTSLFEAAAHQLSASLGQRADALIQDDPIESLVGIGTLLVDLAAEHPRLFEFNQVSPAAVAAFDRLDEHPLLMIGVDPDPTALGEAEAALAAVGVPALLLRGDVTDPDGLRSALAEHGIRIVGYDVAMRRLLDAKPVVEVDAEPRTTPAAGISRAGSA